MKVFASRQIIFIVVFLQAILICVLPAIQLFNKQCSYISATEHESL